MCEYLNRRESEKKTSVQWSCAGTGEKSTGRGYQVLLPIPCNYIIMSYALVDNTIIFPPSIPFLYKV